MMHFDFQVGDLDSAVAATVALGATVAEPSRRRTSGCSSTRPDARSASASTGHDREPHRPGAARHPMTDIR
ncbi:VOC family protein [Streptomyces sp. NPDC057496]|uniref:VOC family protein n=1 Tax=Streptomyces sp. NPDC057496 TaxID=3346149 RepID=UPI003699BAB5